MRWAGDSGPPLEDLAQRLGAVVQPSSAEQRQDHDDGDVRSGLQQVLRDVGAVRLEVQLQGDGTAEEVGADDRLHRVPGGEDDERHGDEAATDRHVLRPVEGERRRQLRTTDAGERAAEQRGDVADLGGRHAVGEEHLGTLAGGADHEAEARAVQHEPGDRPGQDGQVGQRVVIEQDRPEERKVGETRDRHRGERVDALADVVLAEQRGQTDAEERHDETGGDLVGAAGQHHERVDERERRPRPGRRRGRRATRCPSRSPRCTR